MHILLVEDDRHLADVLVAMLTGQKYEVDVVHDGQAGWESTQGTDYDLILLDVGLPKLDGISLCQKLRSHDFQVPILLLTSRDNQRDKVKGLDSGADDYMVKPLDFEELAARIRAVLRRQSEVASGVLTWEKMVLDRNTCEVHYDGNPLKLTPKEYGLLELFMGNRQRTFSIDNILDRLWSFEDPPTENTVRAHIKGLRQKLKASGACSDFIETVYGLGYRLNQKLERPPQPPKSPDSEASALLKSQLDQSVNKIWERFRANFGDRIAVIERAGVAAQAGQLDPQLRQEARQEAHKLAGSLGTFGRAEGSAIARQIEALLQDDTPWSGDRIAALPELTRNLRRSVETPKPAIPEPPGPPEIPGPRLVAIDSGDPFLGELAAEAKHHNIEPEIVPDEAALRRLCIRADTSLPPGEFPRVVLLDFDRHPCPDLLAELNRQTPPVPAIVLATRGDIAKRVEIVRLGGSAFLEKPVAADRAIAVVADLLRQHYATDTRVMIVDDDPAMLATIQAFLQPWGIQTVTLDDPRQFWETLESTVPHLLVLDIEMPHLNGIELCQIVRTDPRWQSVPVLFLTAHTDVKIQHQVFAAGADDYLTKPITGSELATRIVNRLKRTQTLLKFEA
ncbi:response regulator [Lyngbya sp. CCY1209]|uniref:response regulator n=1 Tax=Lyngbya sp. CCY1209 TaxID=2886103 RepID=UPI002D20FD49|nr:response regulator [Lyngbya sp. CCY1209]MEB3883546.1 response regulator [Lyngbya sp. CCY1209]